MKLLERILLVIKAVIKIVLNLLKKKPKPEEPADLKYEDFIKEPGTGADLPVEEPKVSKLFGIVILIMLIGGCSKKGSESHKINDFIKDKDQIIVSRCKTINVNRGYPTIVYRIRRLSAYGY